MSDDLPISDFADQLHDDLIMKPLTDSGNTGFSNDLEKGASVDEVAKTASRRVFLQPRYLPLEKLDDSTAYTMNKRCASIIRSSQQISREFRRSLLA